MNFKFSAIDFQNNLGEDRHSEFRIPNSEFSHLQAVTPLSEPIAINNVTPLPETT